MKEKGLINGKSITEWIRDDPLLNNIIKYQPVYWENKNLTSIEETKPNLPLNVDDMLEAENRLLRFAPLIKKLFPETINSNGIIESELVEIPIMKNELEKLYGDNLSSKIYLKNDSYLPIAGSIKARGGIYEVLKYVEILALTHELISVNDEYSILAEPKFRQFFSQYSIAVGSTGNLGLSIGMIGTTLGFNVTIHMSEDAKEWKKELLRNIGATVIEYQSDYSSAVSKGRKQSEKNQMMYFIDDEQSADLFLGYSVAALRLKEQFKLQNIKISESQPLFVYLPCGVGGAPGGICFGLKMIFGNNVHCIFAEPTHSPSMLLGLMTNLHHKVHISDFGVDNKTEADGLAVGSPSKFVGEMMKNLLDAIYTIDDDEMFKLLALLYQSEGIKIEPSAAAGLIGPFNLKRHTNKNIDKALHLVWSTGGALVPEGIMNEYLTIGQQLLNLR